MTDPTPLQQPAGEKLVCRNVWKLFGPRARETLNRLGAVATPDRLNEAGLVPAVRDVSLAVREGEIFVIM
ncbi:MAG: hypothetical protein KDD96_04970, partial [Rhodobacteraceae bacterium]|nr:hypothetical protein [Paracoccaceae bacterium]